MTANPTLRTDATAEDRRFAHKANRHHVAQNLRSGRWDDAEDAD